MRHLPLLLLPLALALLPRCAEVRFEKSPYAIRGLDVVYSAQEDVTFLAWRLKQGIDPDQVAFELRTTEEGRWQSIDLQSAPFPSPPYDCDQGYVCFQFQLPGQHDWGEETPLRSIQREQGIFAGSTPRYYETRQTFGIDPMALDQNAVIDPKRYDWFSEVKIPLRRDYQWQLVPGNRLDYRANQASRCSQAVPSAWKALAPRLSPEDTWTQVPVCMVARPKRQDQPGAEVTRPFPPSAVLHAETQRYLPAEELAPAIMVPLVDLLIRSEARCARTREEILGKVAGFFRDDSVVLETYTPVDIQSGEPFDGCRQRSDQDYPARQMIEDIKREAGGLAPRKIRVVLVYLNNVDLPPSERIAQRLFELYTELQRIDNVRPYTLAVGSNLILTESIPWDYTVGWRPIDDDVFLEDLVGWGNATMPFRTMLHDLSTQVVIDKPVPAGTPKYFKICAVTPDTIRRVGTTGGGSYPAQSEFQRLYPWPQDGATVFYTLDLGVQDRVPYTEYTREPTFLVVETCEAFCDLPFRAASGTDYPSWTERGGRCQWEE